MNTPTQPKLTSLPAALKEIERLEKVVIQIACPHNNTEGGNDYLYCRDCGLEWDYRKLSEPNYKELARKALKVPDSIPLTLKSRTAKEGEEGSGMTVEELEDNGIYAKEGEEGLGTGEPYDPATFKGVNEHGVCEDCGVGVAGLCPPCEKKFADMPHPVDGSREARAQGLETKGDKL